MVGLSIPPPESSQPIEPERLLEMDYYLKEGLKGVKHDEYCDISTLKEEVDSRADALRSGKADESLPPYLIFPPITSHQLANIHRLHKT